MIISERIVIIGLVVGEASGDILGAGLIRALREYLPKVRFFGVAGPCMKAERMKSWYEMEDLTVMGIVEVIQHLPKILKIRNNLIRRFIALKPDVFIGIDFPDFNIPLEDRLKKIGIQTIHYVSPSIWAWRYKRIFQIKRATQKVLSILPFEKDIYDKLNVPCQFIGHAMADIIPLDPDKVAARHILNISENNPCIALLPGSRYSEVKMLSSIFLNSAKLLRQRFPKLEILVLLVNQERSNQFQRIKEKVAPELHVNLIHNRACQAMIASDVALLASGTATLECMLAKCPMIVCYRMNPLTFYLASKLIKTKWISIPNLLANRELVMEVLQNKCHPDNLVEELTILLIDHHHRKHLLASFKLLHKKIRCNANKYAALEVLKLINL